MITTRYTGTVPETGGRSATSPQPKSRRPTAVTSIRPTRPEESTKRAPATPRSNQSVRAPSPSWSRALDYGSVIRARTVVWAAGVKANPLAGAHGLPQTKRGEIVVKADLAVPGNPDVFVIDDLAGATNPAGTPYPQPPRWQSRLDTTLRAASYGGQRGSRPGRSTTSTKGSWQRSGGAPRLRSWRSAFGSEGRSVGSAGSGHTWSS
jgi:hypothetical protein